MCIFRGVFSFPVPLRADSTCIFQWREVPKDRLMESKIRCVFEDSEGDGNATEGNSARAEPPAYSAAMERHTSDNDHASVRTTTHVTQADVILLALEAQFYADFPCCISEFGDRTYGT